MEILAAGPFCEYWESVRGRTKRVIAVIPPAQLEWAPGPGRWTFGDVIRHLAGIERDMYAENVQGRRSRYPGHGRQLADGWEAVMAYLDAKHAEAMEVFRALTPEQLKGKSQTPAGIPITTAKWLRAMVEHEVHHRGQVYLMLGLLGVEVPPLYGLTEEEVRSRSGH